MDSETQRAYPIQLVLILAFDSVNREEETFFTPSLHLCVAASSSMQGPEANVRQLKGPGCDGKLQGRQTPSTPMQTLLLYPVPRRSFLYQKGDRL